MVVAGAISAIDQALWDLRGRHFEVPGLAAAGRPYRAGRPGHEGHHRHSPASVAAAAAKAATGRLLRGEGDSASATSTTDAARGRGSPTWSERFAAIRDTVGWDLDVGIELHRNMAPGDAVQLCDDIARLRPFFVEDPIPPDSVLAFGEVAGPGAACRWPRANGTPRSGSSATTSSSPAVSYLRPDVGIAGGITHVRKICALAEAHHQGILPHAVPSGPVATAAHVHLGYRDAELGGAGARRAGPLAGRRRREGGRPARRRLAPCAGRSGPRHGPGRGRRWPAPRSNGPASGARFARTVRWRSDERTGHPPGGRPTSGIACHPRLRDGYLAPARPHPAGRSFADVPAADFTGPSTVTGPPPSDPEPQAAFAVRVRTRRPGRLPRRPRVTEGYSRPHRAPDRRRTGGRRFAGRIDVEAADRRGVVVVDTTHGSSTPGRRVGAGPVDYRAARRRRTVPRPVAGRRTTAPLDGGRPRELTGKRVGLVGFGHIAWRLLELLGPFDVDLVAYDPFAPRELADALRVTFAPLDTVLGTSRRGHLPGTVDVADPRPDRRPRARPAAGRKRLRQRVPWRRRRHRRPRRKAAAATTSSPASTSTTRSRFPSTRRSACCPTSSCPRISPARRPSRGRGSSS